jgi:WD40 repeat protein
VITAIILDASAYDWTLPSAPIRNFEAHQDGSSVTALAWNGVTLIPGSASGMAHVWDVLTFEHLRTFVSPISRDRAGCAGPKDKPVSHILIWSERELLLVVTCGGSGYGVESWAPGPVPKNGKGTGVILDFWVVYPVALKYN